MGTMYMAHGFALLLWAVLVLVTFWATATILRRLGFSPLWALLLFVPLGNIIGLVVLARARWPAVDR